MNLLIIALVASVVLNVIFIVEKLVKLIRRKFDEAVESAVIRRTTHKPLKKRQLSRNMSLEHEPRQSGQQPYRIPHGG